MINTQEAKSEYRLREMIFSLRRRAAKARATLCMSE